MNRGLQTIHYCCFYMQVHVLLSSCANPVDSHVHRMYILQLSPLSHCRGTADCQRYEQYVLEEQQQLQHRMQYFATHVESVRTTSGQSVKSTCTGEEDKTRSGNLTAGILDKDLLHPLLCTVSKVPHRHTSLGHADGVCICIQWVIFGYL